MEREMLDKLIEQEIKIKELKEENFVLISQLNVEQPDYKKRIDKVIEYIEENIDNGNELVFTQKGKWTTFQFRADNIILEILKGKDK